MSTGDTTPRGNEADEPVQFGTLEVMDPYAGMKALLSELLGEKVTLHVMSGMRVVGKVAGDNGLDDGIVTVKSGGMPHHVPVHMIVVVEEMRD